MSAPQRVIEARIEAVRRKWTPLQEQPEFWPSMPYAVVHGITYPKPHYVLHIYYTAPAGVPHYKRMQYAWYFIEREDGTRTGRHRLIRDTYRRLPVKTVTQVAD